MNQIPQRRDLGVVIHDLVELTDRISDFIPAAPSLNVADVDALHIEANRMWNVLRELRPRTEKAA